MKVVPRVVLYRDSSFVWVGSAHAAGSLQTTFRSSSFLSLYPSYSLSLPILPNLSFLLCGRAGALPRRVKNPPLHNMSGHTKYGGSREGCIVARWPFLYGQVAISLAERLTKKTSPY